MSVVTDIHVLINSQFIFYYIPSENKTLKQNLHSK